MAINVFLLITGYFMCRQEFKWKKVIGLYCLIKFYSLTIYLIFLLSGYEAFTLKECYKTVFNVSFEFGKGFVSSFIGLYFLVPFINKFISVLDENAFEKMLLILFVMFMGISTFLLNTSFEYIGWYVMVYLTGAYIRLYPPAILKNKKIMAIASAVLLLLSWCSVAFIFFVSLKVKRVLPYYWFVNDSNKILAFLPAVALFCLFKELRLGHSRIINAFASCTLSVLLIHASSDTMRRWLWQDVLKNTTAFEESWFAIHAVVSTLCVYFACVLIDLIRKQGLNFIKAKH